MEISSLIGFLHRIDQDATLFLNSLDSPLTDQFWQFMSDKFVWAPAYAICIFFLFKRLGWKKALIVICSAVLGFAMCDQLSNLVKDAVDRLRPNYSSRMLSEGLVMLERRAGMFGFFSAHAANAFSLALSLIIGLRNDRHHTYKTFRNGALIWATLVSLSRIFVGKHYLGDVLVGSIIGMLIGFSVGMLARFIIQKYIDKVRPTGLTFNIDKIRKPQMLQAGQDSLHLDSPGPLHKHGGLPNRVALQPKGKRD